MERTGDHSPKLDVTRLAPDASHWFRTLQIAPIAAPTCPILRAERSRLSRFNTNSGLSCHLNLSTLTFEVGFSTSDVTLSPWVILTNLSFGCHRAIVNPPVAIADLGEPCHPVIMAHAMGHWGRSTPSGVGEI